MQQGGLDYPNKGEKVFERHFLVRLCLGKEVLDFLTNTHFFIARLWKGRASPMKFLFGQAIQMVGLDSRLFGDAPSRKVVLCDRLCIDIVHCGSQTLEYPGVTEAFPPRRRA